MLISRLRNDPLWNQPAPGWNPDRPLDADGEALRRLEKLFRKHSNDLSDLRTWDAVIAAMLDPTNETIVQQLLGRPASEVWCPSCGTFAAQHLQGVPNPRADSSELKFDEAWMTAFHAVRYDQVRPVGASGEAQTDFQDIRMLNQARGLTSEGVVLRGSGENLFRQVFSLLLQHPEKIRGVTMAVSREENGQQMHHALTFVNSPDGQILLLDRDQRFAVSIQGSAITLKGDKAQMDLRAFTRLNPPRPTALLLSLQPDLELGEVLPKGARRAQPRELEAQTVCCGVVNFPNVISSQELERLGRHAVPDFSTLDMGKAAIRLLEPRGFDNASLMVKYEIPFKGTAGIQPVLSNRELRDWARKNQVYLKTDSHDNLTGIRFFGVARVTGSATANQKFMEEQIQARVVQIVSGFFQRMGYEGVQVEKDPFSADWIVRQVTAQVGQDKVVKSIGRVSSRGTFYHTRFATKGGYQLANAHYWVASLGKLLRDPKGKVTKNLSELLGIDFSKVEWQDAIWTLSHNGDWETYDWVRAYFENKLGISFEGTTDSEVLLYLLLLLSITKKDSRIEIEQPEIAVTRLFRLIDVLEVLKAAALQLDAVETEIRSIRLALAGRQWLAEKVSEAELEKEKLENQLKEARARQAHDDVLKSLEARIKDLKDSLDGRKWSSKTAEEKEKRSQELSGSAEKVRERLGSNGFVVQNHSLLPTVPLGAKKLSEEFIAVLERGLQDTSSLDRLANQDNGWIGYYAFPGADGEMRGLGADLAESAPADFRKAFGKGLNITIQLSSLNDPYGGVIARTYPKSTAGYLVVGRDENQEIDRVAALSEVRGGAPQMGHEDRRLRLAEGIYVIYGSVETQDIPGWSVYTLDGLKVRERQVWNGASRDVVLNDEVRSQDAAWIHVDPEGEALYNTLSAFELEAMVQQVTITETMDRYTRQQANGLWAPDIQRVEISDSEREKIKGEIARLKKEKSVPKLNPAREAHLAMRISELEKQLARADGTGLTAEALRRLSERKGKVVKSGSGSSTFMMEIADAKDPYADIIQSSDDLRLNPPPYLFDADTTLVIATQSGETGSARELAEILLDRAGESDTARLLANRILALAGSPDETAHRMATKVASSSKETPEAKKLAENVLASKEAKSLEEIAREVVKKGGLVIVITNSPGSSLFKIGQKSGGVLLTRSTPEHAVAASGTTSHTIALDRLVGIAVGQARGEITAERAHQRIDLMRRHGTRSTDEEEKPGTLAKVLDGFFLNQQRPEHIDQNDSFYQRAIHIMEYMKYVSTLLWKKGQPGYGEDIRPVNITIIGRNAMGARLAREVNLKMAEMIGKPGWPISESEFLEHDISVHNGEMSLSHRPVRPPWNPATVVQTIRDNRAQFATLDGFNLPAHPGRVLIVGNAVDLIPMSMMRAAYQDVFPVPLKVMTYEEALTQGDKTYQPAEDALVIFVRPGEGMVSGAGPMDLASELIRRWNLPKDRQICLCSANPAQLASALRESSQLGNIRELKGEARDLEFAVSAALDSLAAQLSLRLIAEHPEYGEEWQETTRAAVSERQSSREAAVDGGIQETIASTASNEGYNYLPINRIIEFASARSGHMGWANFSIWPEGYGVREWLARDFAMLVRLALGKSVFPEQPSNGSHGNHGARHPGGELVMWYPPVGPTERAAYDTDFNKKVEEVIPRGVNHPFPSEREPGFFVLMGTRDQQNKRGPGEHFVELRRLRHQAQDKTTLPDGTVLEMTTPDTVLATPTGDLFEMLVLNRLVADRLARARADLLAGKGKQNARPGELVINIDPGLPGPERHLYYEQLRKRFPIGQATIVTFTGDPVDEQYIHGNSDHVFLLPTGGPVEILSAVHGLSAVLARERYAGLAARAAPVAQAINRELKSPNRGIFGPPGPSQEGYDDPDPGKQKFLGAVEIVRLYATYANRDPSSLKPDERVWQDRVKRAISALETKHLSPGEVMRLLEDAVEIYRVQLVPVFGFAHDPKELIKYLIFQIQGLAKVVTNLGGISIQPEYRREDPGLLSTTLGMVAEGQMTSGKMVPLIVGAMQDNPNLEDGLRSVLGVLHESPVASANRQAVASIFWGAVGDSLQQIAQHLLSQMPDHRYTRLTLGLGYPAAAATDPDSGGFVLDLLALASPELAEQLIEDEMRHIRYQSMVQSLNTELVVLQGVPPGSAGQSQNLIRNALAEATFLLGQAHRFQQTILPGRRLNIIGLLEGYSPLQAGPAYTSFMLLPGGRTDYSQSRFWEAMKVVAETPAYGEVSVMAGFLLEQQDRVGVEVWRAAHPLVEAVERETLVTQAGAEELENGVHYYLDEDNNAVFKQSVEIRNPATLPNGVTLNPQGNSIVIGEKTILFKGSTVKGPVVIGRDAEAGGMLVGTADKPLVIGDRAKIHRPQADVKYSVVGPDTKIDGADISNSTLVSFVRDGKTVHASVDNGTVLEDDVVVIGGEVGTGAKLYIHTVAGPYSKVLNNAEIDATFFWGVKPDAGVNFRHNGYLGGVWAMPVFIDGDLFAVESDVKLKQIMRASMFGKLIKSEPAEPAPISDTGIKWNVVFEVDGKQESFAVQRINFGAGTTSSDYNPLTGGKGSGVVLAGGATGVGAVLKAPFLMAERSMVASLSQGEGHLTLGTLVGGVLKSKLDDSLSAYLKLEGLRLRDFELGDGISQEVRVQSLYFRYLQVTAEVLAEAAHRAEEPFAQAGFAAAARAVAGQFQYTAPRYIKILTDALELSLANMTRDSEKAAKKAGKIKEHQGLLAKRDQILREIEEAGLATQRAADSVAPASQVALAEAVRRQILKPEFVWKNPLAGAGKRLADVMDLGAVDVIYPKPPATLPDFSQGAVISMDAGVASRFEASVKAAIAAGQAPPNAETNKLLADLDGKPAGIWPKLAARKMGLPVISVVGARKEDVTAAFLREIPDLVFAVDTPLSQGTGHATYSGLAVRELEQAPFVIVTAGDQPLFDREVFEAVQKAYLEGQQQDPPADLVVAVAVVKNPAGKGRVLDDAAGNVLGILEQKDIEKGATLGNYSQEELLAWNRVNVSVYAAKPSLLKGLLAETTNDNAQGQFYVTDIVKMLVQHGKRVVTVVIPEEKQPDVTNLADLKAIAQVMAQQHQAGAEEGVPPVIERPIVAVAEPILQETEAGAARTVPADMARILESLGEFRDTTVETGVYGLIFAERAGLAVGVTLRSARDQDGKPLARRYVAANESQEQTLVDLGVARAEIIRAWAPEFKGDVNLAIAAAKAQLEADGAVVMEPIRGITATFAQLIQEIRNIEALLTPRDYSAESAAKIAQRIYDLFV